MGSCWYAACNAWASVRYNKLPLGDYLNDQVTRRTGGSLLAFAGIASADISVTPAVVPDYDFRGISQTKEDPAFQLGLNYNHASGFYAGLWGSNVEFGPGDPSIEVDLFAGFAGGDAKESFGYDVGAIDARIPARAT